MLSKKYDKKDWRWNILYMDIPINQLCNMEKWCIFNYNTYNNGYNSTIGGEESPSKNPKTAKKISKANTGRKLSKIGYDNVVRAIKSRANPMNNPENRKKISIANTGRKQSTEHIKRNAEAHAKYYKITKPNGDIETINNLSQYCRNNNLNVGNMCGTYKSHKGYKCEKINNIKDKNNV